MYFCLTLQKSKRNLSKVVQTRSHLCPDTVVILTGGFSLIISSVWLARRAYKLTLMTEMADVNVCLLNNIHSLG